MSSVDTNGGRWGVRRRFVVACAAVLAMVGIAAAGAVAFRHDIVRWVIADRAADLGWTAEFKVDTVTLRGIAVTGFRAGDALSFDRLSVAYTLAGLAAGNIGKVELTGLSADLGRLKLPRGSEDDNDVPARIDLTGLPDLSLRNARLILPTPGGDAVARMDATLSKDSGSAQTARTLSIRLRGKVAVPAGEVSMTFDGTAMAADPVLPTVTGRLTLAAPKIATNGLRIEAVNMAAPIKITLDAATVGFKIQPKILLRAQRVATEDGISIGPVSGAITGDGSADIGAGGRASMDLDVDLRTARLRVAGLATSSVRAILPLRIAHANGSTRLDIRRGARIAIKSVRINEQAKIAALNATLGGTVVIDPPVGDSLAGPLPLLLHDLSARFMPFSISGNQPIGIQPGPIMLTGGLSRTGEYMGRVVSAETRATLGHRRLAISDFSLALAPDAKSRRLTTKLKIASLRDLSSPPVLTTMTARATLRRVEPGFAFTAHAGPPAAPDMIEIEGVHDPDGGIGHADISAADINFVPGGLQPMTLVPGLASVRNVSGRVAAMARLDWIAGKLDGHGRIDLEQLGGETVDGKIDGLSGTVKLDRLFPPSSPPNQRLVIRRIDAGAALTNTRIRFALKPSGILRIDSAAATMAGGRINLVAPAVDLLAQKARGTLNVRGVRLGELVTLLNLDGVTATGRLDGAIPVKLANGKVSIAKGGLNTRGGGTLRIKSERAARILQGGGEQVALMLKALENFDYDRLSVEIHKSPAGAARVVLRTLGRNREVLNGRSFQINVNLQTNLDKLLEAALQWYRLSGRTLSDIVGGGQRGPGKRQRTR